MSTSVEPDTPSKQEEPGIARRCRGWKTYITPAILLVIVALTLSVYLPNRQLFSHFKAYYIQAYEIGWKIRLERAFGKFGDPPKTSGVSKTIPVLVYHGVLDKPAADDKTNISLANFADQMKALKKAGYQTISMEQFADFVDGKIQLPEKSFLLTFDDGRKDSYYPTTPILSALGYQATIFVIANEIDNRGSFYLNRAELLDMEHSGTWDLELHTYAGHGYIPIGPNGQQGFFFSDKMWLAAAGRLETDAEFQDRVSKDVSRGLYAMSTDLSRKVAAFAFPFSEYSSSSIEALQKCGLVTFTVHAQGATYTLDYMGRGAPLNRIDGPSFANGKQLVQVLEAAKEKDLPYSMSKRGDHLSAEWLRCWGGLSFDNNRINVFSVADETTAFALLDGTRTWGDYKFSAKVHWTSGDEVMLVARYHDENNYICLSASNSSFTLEQHINGVCSDIAVAPNSNFVEGQTAQLDINVAGNKVDGLLNGKEVVGGIAKDGEDPTGGVGLKVWGKVPGLARMTVSDVLVAKD